MIDLLLDDITLLAGGRGGARKNATQRVKYPRILSVKPSNKVYLFICLFFNYMTELQVICRTQSYYATPITHKKPFFGLLHNCLNCDSTAMVRYSFHKSL